MIKLLVRLSSKIFAVFGSFSRKFQEFQWNSECLESDMAAAIRSVSATLHVATVTGTCAAEHNALLHAFSSA
jgi:hypothetical protein